jgi:hypothetical protein
VVQQLINSSTKLIAPRADGLEIGVKEIDNIENSPIVNPEENYIFTHGESFSYRYGFHEIRCHPFIINIYIQLI